MNSSYMGIDPGKYGGICVLGDQGVWLEPMPLDDGEIDVKELNRLIYDHRMDVAACYIEKVHAMPKNGSIACFKLGYSFGLLKGILASNEIRVVEVRPQVWMAEMHAEVHKFAKETKTRSREAFNRLFPGVDARRTARCEVNDDGLVEAALIAEFGRRNPHLVQYTGGDV